MRSQYTAAQVDWLLNHFRGYDNYADLTDEFNKRFKEDRPVKSVQNKCLNSGFFIRQSVEEETEWIRQQRENGIKFVEILKRYRAIYGEARPDFKIFEMYKKIKSDEEGTVKLKLRTFIASWKANKGRKGRCLYYSRYDAGTLANANDGIKFLQGAYDDITGFSLEKIYEL